MMKRITCHYQIKGTVFKRKVDTVVAHESKIVGSFFFGTDSVSQQRFFHDIQPDHITACILLCNRESKITASGADVEYLHSVFDADKLNYLFQVFAVLCLSVVKLT